MEKLLVTGADGFIGSHLVDRLVKTGKRVKALVQYNSFESIGYLDHLPNEILQEVEITSGDIRDPNFVSNLVSDCDKVFHLAALIAIPYSYLAAHSYVETNCGGTLNVLQACLKYDVARLVHTSTSEVYGSAQYVPIDENHPLVGQSPYSASKIAADQIAHSFFTSYELPVVTIRPFNTFGPRQSRRAVIPTIICQLLEGKYLKLGNLSATRDFNFVDDITDGFVRAMEAEDNKVLGETINLGSNFEISIMDLAFLIAKIMDVQCELVQDSERLRPKLSEVDRLWASNTKANHLIGWEPKYPGESGLRYGLEKTVAWFETARKHKKFSDKYVI